MFTDFIKQILGAERRTTTSNRLENAVPSVIAKKDSNKPIPEKYEKDIEALRKKYGEICPRERRRTDAYTGLISFLKAKLGITLIIKSQKSKL